MAFAETELKRIDWTVGGLCRRKSPAALRDKVRLEYRVTRHDVLIYETRPAFHDPRHRIEHGIAKLRFVRPAGEWRLFWLRASLKWQSYEPFRSSPELAELVTEIERDPNGCFFG